MADLCDEWAVIAHTGLYVEKGSRGRPHNGLNIKFVDEKGLPRPITGYSEQAS